MSNIQIAGDTSGSVTLQAPATAGSTTLTLPATSGTVLTSASSIATSQLGTGPATSSTYLRGDSTWATAGGGQIQTQLFTSPGTFTTPSSVTQVRVTVIGGGGGGIYASTAPGDGGYGGLASAICPVTAGVPISVTIGSGGTGGNGAGGQTSGATSSFGSLVSATGGGTSGGAGSAGSPGSGTVTTGTAIKTGNMSPGNFSQIQGSNKNPTGPAAVSYSTSIAYIAGGSGAYSTVPYAFGGGGIGGAVVVEFVG